MSDDRPAVYTVGEEVIYRASSLGSCIRALAAARQELPAWEGKAPENVQKAWDKGNEMEEAGLKKYGTEVFNRQREVRLELTPKIIVVGHIDGESEAGIVEVKRQSDKEWAAKTIEESWLWDKYAWQFSSYMLSLHKPLACIRISDNEDIKIQTFISPPKSAVDIMRRVLSVEAMATKDLKSQECDRSDFPCPYWQLLHPGRGEGIEVREVEDSELGDWSLHYARYKMMEREGREGSGKLRDKIIERVGKGKAVREKISGIFVKVTTYPVKESVRPSTTATRVDVELPGERESDEP